MLQKDARLRPGAGEVLYRLGAGQRCLRRDGALGGERVAPHRAHEPRRSSAAISRWTRCCTSSSARDAAMGVSSCSRPRRASARRRSSMHSCGCSRIAAKSLRVGRGRCSERLAGSEAYLPVLEVLDSLQRSEQHGSLSRLMRALAPSWYVQIMPLAKNDSSAARLAADIADRIAGTAEAGDLRAARGSHPDASGRPLLRRRALGRSLDDRSDWLSGAADRQRCAC